MTRPAAIACVSTLVACLTLATYLARYDWNLGALIAMPDHWALCLADVPAGIPIWHRSGSDGGYNYAAARDPFLVRMYAPCAEYPLAYALERWLYQFASWAVALGREPWLPFSMPLVNIFSVGLTAFVIAKALQGRGINQWWALPCALNPGAWQPLRFNLVDPLFVFLVVAALYTFDKGWRLRTALLLSLVMLARGLGIGVVLTLAAVVALQRKWLEAGLYLLSTAPYFLILKPWLASRLSFPAVVFGGADSFEWPLVVPFRQLAGLLWAGDTLRSAVLIVGVGFFVASLAIALWNVVERRRLRYEALLVAGYSAASLSIEGAWGSTYVQFFRVVAFVFPCLVYLLAGDRHWPARLMLFSIPIMSVLWASWMMFGPLMS